MKSYQNIYSILTKEEKKNFKFLILMMFFAMIFETLGIAAIIPIINFFTNQSIEIRYFSFKFFENLDKSHQIIFLVSVIFTIYILKNIYLTLYYYLETKFSYNFRYNLGSRLFNYYLSKPYSFHLENHTSKLMTKINQEIQLAGSSILNVSVLITETLIITGITSLILLVRPYETIITLLITTIMGLIYYLIFKKKSLFLGKELVRAQKSKMKVLNESLNSIKEILIFKAKKFFKKKFHQESNQVSFFNHRMVFINRLPKIYFEIVLLLIIISILTFSFLTNKDVMNTISTLSIFLISSLKIVPSLNKILISLQSIKYAEATINSLKKDVDSITVDYDQEKQKIFFPKSFSKITLKNLSYVDPDSNNQILENINFDIQSNNFIAITGKTGSGKTTLINLLSGILKPSSGDILIDGASVKNKYEKLVDLVSYVPQNIYLFDDTIRNNIAFGEEEKNISEKKLINSIRQANLDNFFSEFNDLNRVKVGENASMISGGQKQRIAIARALYKDSPILILDEPTSSLDKKTSEKILSFFKNLSKKKTVIMITHHIHNESFFSKIYKVQDKTISLLKK